MPTVTISKNEYSRIIRTQDELKKRVDLLQKRFEEEVLDEVSPAYARKLERISKEMDQGKGTRFNNADDAVAYLDNL